MFKNGFLLLLTSIFALPAFADEAILSAGDTAWVLAASAMVLLMTPGLAFFYGGMVGKKNVVTTIFQSMMAICVLGLTWAIAGYSLSFSGNVGGFIGDLNHFFLNGVGQEVRSGTTIPDLAFMIFQCMFAVITPALITGAFAERTRFHAWLIFGVLWSLFVYAPICHWVWGSGGWIASMGGLDFAGGLVVHMSAGFSALIFAKVLGKGTGFGQTKPYDVGMIALGTALLFFGWFGFNAGSALAANGLASSAFVVTFLCACATALSWGLFDLIKNGKMNLTGVCIAIVVGLVVITPASGFVSPAAAIIMGLLAGPIVNFVAGFVKQKLNIDDRLDVFACHGIGGLLGVIFTGLFASTAVNSAASNGLFHGNPGLLVNQLIAALAVATFSMTMTYVIMKIQSLVVPFHVSHDVEKNGLDSVEHGESINNYINAA